MTQKIPTWFGPALVVVVSVIIRIRLLPVPLERDEGEYAYVATRLLAGAAPYTEAFSLKMPGIHLTYAMLLRLLGTSPTAIHLGLLVANLCSIAFLGLLARRWLGSTAGYTAGALFAVLSVGSSVQGVFANAEHFVLPAMLAGWWLLHRGVTEGGTRDIVLAGACLAIATLVKQHAALFALAGGIVTVWPRGSGLAWRHGLWLGLGAVIPTGLVMAWLAARGSLDEGVFWTFTYARKYVASLPLDLGMQYLSSRGGDVVRQNGAIVVAALIGLWTLRNNSQRRWWVAFGMASLAAVTPGLYFRPHYFVLLLPALALAGAAALAQLESRRPVAEVALAGMVALTLLGQSSFVFGSTDNALTTCYGTEPFRESVQIARELKARTQPDDTIAVLGSEPQICFYAERRSATGHIYMYPLMETHPYARQMQDDAMQEIEAAAPAFLVFFNYPTSWIATEQSDRTIMAWAQQYWRQNYDRVGLVEMRPGQPSRYFWDDEASRLPQSKDWIGIFRRR